MAVHPTTVRLGAFRKITRIPAARAGRRVSSDRALVLRSGLRGEGLKDVIAGLVYISFLGLVYIRSIQSLYRFEDWIIDGLVEKTFVVESQPNKHEVVCCRTVPEQGGAPKIQHLQFPSLTPRIVTM